MSLVPEGGTSRLPSRAQKREYEVETVCGLTGNEVKEILRHVNVDEMYISEEEPFVDSGSEYIPDSDSESESLEDPQSFDESSKENSTQNKAQKVDKAKEGPKEVEIVWTKNTFVPDVHFFDGSNSGLKNIDLTEETKEIEYFLNLFTQEIANIITEETNRYANQRKEKKWKDFEISELYVFIALTLLMPRVKKLNVKEYWIQDNLLHTTVFGQHMSRDRYIQISRNLHFANNEDAEPDNRLHKVEAVLNRLKERFLSAFYPFQNLVIDESMVLFKGRLGFKQYIKTKKLRYGIKLYVLCDCETGIVLDFIVYVGKNTNIKCQDIAGLGSSGAVVVKLLEPYLNKGHSFYSDNFYTSPLLSTFLFEKKTNSCGTVRQNSNRCTYLIRN